MTCTFIRSPGFSTPTELVAWLLEQGVAPIDWRIYRGPDATWRGSGPRHLQDAPGILTTRGAVRLGGVAP